MPDSLILFSNCRHLFRKLKNEHKVGKFRFVNPHTLGLMCEFGKDKKASKKLMEDRSRLLADLLRGTAIGQLVLVPLNVGYVVKFQI